MLERFTDRARKVIELAEQEAERFNNEYVGTEHILLGLIREANGVAAHVLMHLDVNLSKLHCEIDKLILRGPDRLTMTVVGWTPRAKQAMTYAMQEARGMNQNYVGTEHVLLGLLREREGVAAQMLMNLGLKLEQVREEVFNLLGTGLESSVAEAASGGVEADGNDVSDIFVPPRQGRSASRRFRRLAGLLLVDLCWSLPVATVIGLVARSWPVFVVAAVLVAAMSTIRRLS